MADKRELAVRRTRGGKLCLHDVETGEPLPGQAKVEIVQDTGSLTRVVVTFNAQGAGDVKLQVNDD